MFFTWQPERLGTWPEVIGLRSLCNSIVLVFQIHNLVNFRLPPKRVRWIIPTNLLEYSVSRICFKDRFLPFFVLNSYLKLKIIIMSTLWALLWDKAKIFDPVYFGVKLEYLWVKFSLFPDYTEEDGGWVVVGGSPHGHLFQSP